MTAMPWRSDINAIEEDMHKLDVWFKTKLRNAEALLELLIVCILTIYIKFGWMQNATFCIAVRLDFLIQFVFHSKA